MLSIWCGLWYYHAVYQQVSTPADNERGPRYMEKALAAFHQAATQRDVVVLEYASDGEQVGLRVKCHARLAEAVLGPLTANYPECVLAEVDGEDGRSERETWVLELRLVPELFPILRHGQFEDALNRNFADPISAILRAIRPEHSLTGRVEIQIAPASAARHVVAWASMPVPFLQGHAVLNYNQNARTGSPCYSVSFDGSGRNYRVGRDDLGVISKKPSAAS